jgi:predicted nucleic acid-binding Zn ribbon protein
MTDEQDDGESGPPDELANLKGMDLVRRTLEEARGAARSQGKDVGRGGASKGRQAPAKGRRRSWSGPGPDRRDPQTFASASLELARTRGWSARVAEGSVFGQWPTVVGEQIAEHANPASLREGVLTVEAESTAVGDGVVTSLRIVGPAAPTWRKGKYHISGRGPRDTYG